MQSLSLSLSLSYIHFLIFHGSTSIVPRDNRHLTQCQLLPGWRYTACKNETTWYPLSFSFSFSLALPLPRRAMQRRSISVALTAAFVQRLARIHSSLVPNDTSTQRENVSSHRLDATPNSCSRTRIERNACLLIHRYNRSNPHPGDLFFKRQRYCFLLFFNWCMITLYYICYINIFYNEIT